MAGHADLGQLDFDAERNLGQHGVEPRIAGRFREAGPDRLEPRQRTGIECSREQAELEGIESFEFIFTSPTFVPDEVTTVI